MIYLVNRRLSPPAAASKTFCLLHSPQPAKAPPLLPAAPLHPPVPTGSKRLDGSDPQCLHNTLSLLFLLALLRPHPQGQRSFLPKWRERLFKEHTEEEEPAGEGVSERWACYEASTVGLPPCGQGRWQGSRTRGGLHQEGSGRRAAEGNHLLLSEDSLTQGGSK